MARVVSWPDRSRFALSLVVNKENQLRVDCHCLPAKLSHRIRDLDHSFIRQLRIQRQRQHFAANAFGLRQIALAVSEIAEAALQMNGNRIVDAATYPAGIEMFAQLVALRGE